MNKVSPKAWGKGLNSFHLIDKKIGLYGVLLYKILVGKVLTVKIKKENHTLFYKVSFGLGCG
jgi:hypothetical protein